MKSLKVNFKDVSTDFEILSNAAIHGINPILGAISQIYENI